MELILWVEEIVVRIGWVRAMRLELGGPHPLHVPDIIPRRSIALLRCDRQLGPVDLSPQLHPSRRGARAKSSRNGPRLQASMIG